MQNKNGNKIPQMFKISWGLMRVSWDNQNVDLMETLKNVNICLSPIIYPEYSTKTHNEAV